ncbi:MAG: hypothetical protein CMP10_15255, partial [Zetaproteobacteria bacterium]|nr:hypothetical protein [Pseudobdellovibrionaceae bacterium]
MSKLNSKPTNQPNQNHNKKTNNGESGLGDSQLMLDAGRALIADSNIAITKAESSAFLLYLLDLENQNSDQVTTETLTSFIDTHRNKAQEKNQKKWLKAFFMRELPNELTSKWSIHQKKPIAIWIGDPTSDSKKEANMVIEFSELTVSLPTKKEVLWRNILPWLKSNNIDFSLDETPSASETSEWITSFLNECEKSIESEQQDATTELNQAFQLHCQTLEGIHSEEEFRNELKNKITNKFFSKTTDVTNFMHETCFSMIKAKFRNKAKKYGYGHTSVSQQPNDPHLLSMTLNHVLNIIDTPVPITLRGQMEVSQQKLVDLCQTKNKDDFEPIINQVTAVVTKSQASQLIEIKHMIEDVYASFRRKSHSQEKELLDVAKGVIRSNKKDGRYKTLRKNIKKRLGGYAAEVKYQHEIEELRDRSKEYSDYPASWPIARELKRELVFFAGPTNSGKTYHALNALTENESGAYLAPLRLLALEGQEEIENRGKACSFLTGEERDLREGAEFMSSTIELVNLTKKVDAVLIDEIQLIGDPDRGAAWTAALVGAPAKKIFMTGAPEAIPAIQAIAKKMGEKLEVREFKRLAPLEVLDSHTPLAKISDGTAVIAFSRKDVLSLKERIEANSERKVSVIYGNLSPQVRREEARRFRSGETQILVSTDAIAMGLNLPIQHVVFYQVEKYDGEKVRMLAPAELKQIAGRAGRFGLAKNGTVSSLFEDHMDHVSYCLNDKNADLEIPSIFRVMPDHRHVKLIADVIGGDSLEKILVFFRKGMEFESKLFIPTDLDEIIVLSGFADRSLKGDLDQKLTFSLAPVNPDNDIVMNVWFEMIKSWNNEDESNLLFLFNT